ncbi:putative Cyclic nucleotide-binding domain-containing protein [Gammaproteobacteria bacterium]
MSNENSSFLISNLGLVPPDLNWRSTFRWWFVRFNPLYFFSAFCILFGVFNFAENIDSEFQSQLLLFSILQLYEVSLIGSSAVLVHSAKAIRPAILLTLLELVFLLDCTFRLETMIQFGQVGSLVTLAWVSFAGVKLWAMQRVLKIQAALFPFLAAWVLIASLACMIQLLSLRGYQLTVLQVFGGIVAAWSAFFFNYPPKLESALATTETELTYLNRLSKAVFFMLPSFFFYHWINYSMVVYDDSIMPIRLQIGNGMLLWMLFSNSERSILLAAGLAFLFSANNPNSYSFPAIMFIISIGFTYRAIVCKLKNLFVFSALALFFALCIFTAEIKSVHCKVSIHAWQVDLLILLLGFIGWKLQVTFAWVVLGFLFLFKMLFMDWSWVIHFSQWLRPYGGTLFIGMGFLALAGGLAINWVLGNSTTLETPKATENDT